jgi:hypothetical protein
MHDARMMHPRTVGRGKSHHPGTQHPCPLVVNPAAHALSLHAHVHGHVHEHAHVHVNVHVLHGHGQVQV